VRIASLGSGSRGNATLVQHRDTILMVDCGFSAKETERRLAERGLQASDLDAILVTHEHTDHCSGVERLSRRFDLPVYMSHGTLASGRCSEVAAIGHFRSEVLFSIGDIDVTPIAVPHDAREPCQFVFSAGSAKIGVLTDLGSITPLVLQHYAGCQALLLECNHDPQMLAQGSYPPALKRRVGGDWGHLSNEQAAQLLRGLGEECPAQVAIAHISEKNNSREAVLAAFEPEFSQVAPEFVWASQDAGFPWLEVAP
jgi:phosphoribosyl 1,2-cyclic phosphodiesterase